MQRPSAIRQSYALNKQEGKESIDTWISYSREDAWSRVGKGFPEQFVGSRLMGSQGVAEQRIDVIQ